MALRILLNAIVDEADAQIAAGVAYRFAMRHPSRSHTDPAVITVGVGAKRYTYEVAWTKARAVSVLSKNPPNGADARIFPLT